MAYPFPLKVKHPNMTHVFPRGGGTYKGPRVTSLI